MKKFLPLVLFCLQLSRLFSNTINFHETDPNNIKKTLEGKNELEKIILLDNYLQKSPNSLALHLLKAKLELSLRDYLGAEKTLTTASQIFPAEREVQYLLGITYYNLKQYTLAEDIFSQLKNENPQDSAANLFLSLITPVYQGDVETAEKKEYAVSHSPEDYNESFQVKKIKELEALYLEDNTNDLSPYSYLYQEKNIEVKNANTFHYEITGILRVNNLTEINTLKNYPVAYDSSLFHPAKTEAVILSPDNSVIHVSPKNINFTVLGKSPTFKNVIITYPEIRKGSILCYKISFLPISSPTMPKFSDTFYITSPLRTFQKVLSVTYPESLPVTLLNNRIKEPIMPEEKKEGSMITKKFTFLNPEVLSLAQEENISIFDVSPSITITTYEDWTEFGKWYASIFFSSSKQPVSLPFQPEKEKIETLKKTYQYLQAEITPLNNDLKQNNFALKSPASTLQDKSGNIADLNVLLIALLKTNGITAHPLLVSTIYNGQIESYLPSPSSFNYLITYVPKQAGIETELYLDPGTKFTAYDNLPFQIQGVNGLLVKEDGSSLFTRTPIISYEKNRMTEDYRITIDNIGKAKVQFSQNITGSFAEYFRNQIAVTREGATEKLRDFFYQVQKSALPALTPDQLTIKGDDSYSGDFTFHVNTTASNVTQLLFDGKQILSFNLGDLGEWISFPPSTQYSYRKEFPFLFQKKMEYIFPEGYTIQEHNLQNILKENKYFSFEFNTDKIAENHFILESRFILKNVEIPPEDIPALNEYSNILLQEVQFKIVMEKKENFDYEDFFDKLTKEYQQPDLYKNYLNHLISMKKMDKAEKIALEASFLFKENTYFNLLLAMIYYEKEEYDKSERELQSLLGQTSNSRIIYEYLIELYRKTGEDKKLHEILLQAHSQFPEETGFIGAIVDYYRRNDQIEKAIQFLEDTLTLPTLKGNSSLYADLGYLYSIQKNKEKAEQHLKTAIELDGKNSYALNNLAWLYCENDFHLKDAVALAETACRLEPTNDNFLDTLAEAYYKIGEYEKAVEVIRKAIKINPNYTYLEMQLKKIENAMEQINRPAPSQAEEADGE